MYKGLEKYTFLGHLQTILNIATGDLKEKNPNKLDQSLNNSKNILFQLILKLGSMIIYKSNN